MISKAGTQTIDMLKAGD